MGTGHWAFGAAACVFGLAAGTARATLLTNGDFEAGNTGFTTDYEYRTVSVSPYVQQYGVTTSAFAWSQFWNTVQTDHSPVGDKFFIADVGPNLGAVIWRQTVAVPANTDMTFSAWLATWTTFPAVTLRVDVNGSQVGVWGAPSGATWTQYSAGWNSGASTSATISIYAANYFQPGADVAIDDMELVPAPGAAGLAGAALVAGLRRRRR